MTSEEDKKLEHSLRFLLVGLMVSPKGITDNEGNMIFLSSFDIPPDSYIFFIERKEWDELKKTNGKGGEIEKVNGKDKGT